GLCSSTSKNSNARGTTWHCVLPTDLSVVLDEYRPRSDAEAADVDCIRQVAHRGDAWSRSTPLHATGSAVVVHPETRRGLLRWLHLEDAMKNVAEDNLRICLLRIAEMLTKGTQS